MKIDLGQKYECESDDQCGTELLYRQLIKGDVISKEFTELKDYLSLNKLLETNYYPFDKSPEMTIFIEEEYKKNDSPEKNQLESLLKQELSKKINFLKNLDNSYKEKVQNILEFLKEDKAGNQRNIMKLKNDLTNKNSNMQNKNLLNNNLNNYNNGNQMNINNNDMNMNNTKNINMMLNMNQMKMQSPFMISPPVGDFNYNVYNDNENFMNANIYNQNPINGFGINFYNSFKNS